METNDFEPHNLRNKIKSYIYPFCKKHKELSPLGATGAAGVLNVPWDAPAEGVAFGAGVPE